jgi:hypothetical protein
VKGSAGPGGWVSWRPLIVLDAGQFSTRCRCCGWRSGLSSALSDAQAAFQRHPCPVRAIGSFTEPTETPGPRQVGSIAAPGWSDETRVPAATGVRPASW